jgi:hypothetical protein
MVMLLDSFGEFWLGESIGDLAVLATLIRKSKIGPLLPEWVKNASRKTTPITVETVGKIDFFLNDGSLWSQLDSDIGHYKSTAEEWCGHARKNLEFAKYHLYDPVIRAQQEEERRKNPPKPKCHDCNSENLEMIGININQVDWRCKDCGWQAPAITWEDI